MGFFYGFARVIGVIDTSGQRGTAATARTHAATG